MEIFSAFDIDPVTVSYTKFELGQLLWGEGERIRARELIDEAEAVFVSAKDVGAPQLSDLRSWKKRVSF